MRLQYQGPGPGGGLLGPATTKRSRPGRPPPLRVRSKPPSRSRLAPLNVLRAGKRTSRVSGLSVGRDTGPGGTRTGSVSGSEPGRLCACEGNQQRPGHVTTQAPPTRACVRKPVRANVALHLGGTRRFSKGKKKQAFLGCFNRDTPEFDNIVTKLF